MEGELRDDQWALIAPLLPPPKVRVRPRADDRRTINGILWVLRSGARWRRDLPKRYGSPSTCHRRLQEWQDQGVWEQIRLKFLGTLDAQGVLNYCKKCQRVAALIVSSSVPKAKAVVGTTS